MPLRVAEKDGYVKAVNGCGDCLFVNWDGHTILECIHKKIKDKDLMLSDRIPVWCPLPTHLDHMLRASPKTMTEFMVRQENKMRGKHPENIVWDEPAVFVVQAMEGRGSDIFIEIEPALASGPDWTCLRKDDCLIAGKGESIIRCWVRETPTSSRVKVALGGPLKIGALLTVVQIKREEHNA